MIVNENKLKGGTNMAKVATQIRLDESMHKKVKYISEKKLRSLNSQMEYFILKGIEQYEKEYGTIPISDS